MTVERSLRAIAGFFVAGSALLAHLHSQYWLLFTGFVGLNLLQSAFTNWCPMMSLLRMLGVPDRRVGPEGRLLMRQTMMAVSMAVLGLAAGVRAADANAPAAPEVQEIVEKANLAAYYQGDDGKARVKMTITNTQGQKRTREFVILRKDVAEGADQKYFVYFEKPSDVRKMGYLVHKHVEGDDDRWMYMPALDLEKRVAAGDKRTSFVGSDFLYEDVSGRNLAEDAHALVQTTDQTYVIKNTPKNPDSVEFSEFTVVIDRSTFLPMKMEFLDKNGRLYRVIESTQVQTFDGIPTVVRSLVKDLKTGSQTEMEFTDVQYNLGLSDDVFSSRSLRRPPREVLR